MRRLYRNKLVEYGCDCGLPLRRTKANSLVHLHGKHSVRVHDLVMSRQAEPADIERLWSAIDDGAHDLISDAVALRIIASVLSRFDLTEKYVSPPHYNGVEKEG